jgi:anti-sigma factor RsiW
MTSNFEINEDNYNPSDRFELISAYLDGEVSPTERKQVQQWLDHDPEIQQLHSRLLRLRQGFQSLPIPPLSQSPEALATAVFQKIDQRRVRRFWILGTGAIAAIFVGAVVYILPNSNPIPRFAENPSLDTSEALMIAVNQPVVEIPKAAVSTPLKTAN